MQCPKCNIEMDEVRKLDVIIDACARCGGVWLDKGELEKLRGMTNEYRSEHRDDYAAYEREHKHEKRHEHYDKHHQPVHKKKKKSIFEIFEIFE